MGRPPLGGTPAFRFLQTEIADMEKALEENNGLNPPKETIVLLAEKFSASPERLGKITIQWKQIWNWFQNRRHAQRAKSAKMPGNLYFSPSSYDDAIVKGASTNSSASLSEDTGLLLLEDQQSKGEEDNMMDRGFAGRQRGRGRGRGRGRSRSQVGREDKVLLPLEGQQSKEDMGLLLTEDQQLKCEEEDAPDRVSVGRHRGRGRGRGRGRSHSQVGRGRKAPDSPKMEFEAKSARDMAWYDVAGFLTHRMLEPDDPEVQVRFAGFGAEEDEWVNVKRSVRRRSLPCEVSECIAVLPGDLILCFQEGKTQALYYDAHVKNVQRKEHDIRGCRCRFVVIYDHDESEEVVPLRKVCRRPETDFRLQALHASKRSLPVEYGQAPQRIEDSSLCKDSPVMPEVVKGSGDFTDPNTQHARTEMIPTNIVGDGDTPISVIPLQFVSDTAAILNEKSSNPSTPPSMVQILDSNTQDVEMKPADE